MHAPIPAIFSLFILPLSFFLSVLSLLLVFYYSLAMCCSPFVVFPFPGFLSLGAYYSLTMGFPPLSASLHWVSLFRCFSLFPYFSFSSSVFPPPFLPFFCPVIFLLQETDSMRFLSFTPKVSPIVFGLLWASFQDYPLTHWLPLPLLSTCLLQRYSFHDKIPFCLFLLYTSTSLLSSMACIRWSQPFITSFR